MIFNEYKDATSTQYLSLEMKKRITNIYLFLLKEIIFSKYNVKSGR
jgi:hypothetical protein